VRFSALWKPTDALTVLLKAEYNYIDLGGYPGSNSSSPLNETLPNPRSAFDLINNTANYDLDRFGRISLDVSYVFPDGITLRSITAYQQGLTKDATDLSLGNEATFVPPASFPYLTEFFVDDGTQSVTSEELDVVSPSTGKLKWVAGLTAEADFTDIPPGGFNSFYQFGSTLIPAIFLNAQAPRSNQAVFGQVTYDFDEHWTIIVGGRYSWSSNKLVDAEYIEAISTSPIATSNETVTDGHFTGKVAINYNINSDNLLYVFVATGHKAAGLNTTPNFYIGSHDPAPFKGEDVTDYEFGLKSTFFGGHVRTQIGGYYSQYQNFQVNYLDSTLNLSLIENATGTTVLEGLEAQIQAVFGGWTIDANGSVSHSRLGTWIASDPCTVYPAGTIGDPACGGTPINVAGKEQDYAPDATFNMGVQYRFELPGDSTLTPRVDYAYVAPQWGTLFELPVDRLSSRSLVNAQLAFKHGDWGLTAYATNLFNYQYNVYQSEGGTRLPGAPRQYGLRLSKSF
jgi:iron complex outermembrane receptor protein